MSRNLLFACAATMGMAWSPVAGFAAAPSNPPLEPGKDYYAVLDTSLGRMVVSFFEDEAPETVRNFVNLSEGTKPFKDPANRDGGGYYDGTIFHRVMNDFMLQGGDPTGTGRGGPGFNIKGEIVPSLTFTAKDCLMAMANTGHPDTAGAQFFITDVGAKPGWLNGGYTIFGEVVEGRDVVKAICETPVTYQPGMPKTRDQLSRPVEDVQLKSVTILRVEKGSDAWKAMLEGQAAAPDAEASAPMPEPAKDDSATTPTEPGGAHPSSAQK